MMWVCRQELQWSNNGLNETESWRIWRRTGRVEFCGTWSWVDRTGYRLKRTSLWQCSLKLKKEKNHQWQYNRQFSSVAHKSSDGCWGEYSSLSGHVQFSGVICASRSQEIIMSWTWFPLCLSCVGFLATSITFTMWCSLAVTIHCATIAGSMWLWTYSRVELESCHFFSIYCLNEVFCWQRISWWMI